MSWNRQPERRRPARRILLRAGGPTRSGGLPPLTEREREVLELLARGYDNRRIARELYLSDKTVRNHVSNVLARLDAPDRAEAILRA